MSLTQKIKDLITSDLAPIHLELINESEAHHGHRPGSSNETHFSAVIVSEKFVGVPRVRRSQMVFALLNPFMEANGGTLHALSLQTVTPEEWGRQ